MSLALLEALRQEIAVLEGELRGDPRYKKLMALKAALHEYGDISTREHNIERIEATPRTINRKPSEVREKALRLSEEFLSLRSPIGPTPTREIYAWITEQGAEVGGKDPVSNLSAMLSQSEKFNSNGRAGWTLAREAAQRHEQAGARMGGSDDSSHVGNEGSGEGGGDETEDDPWQSVV